jgi:hypothetical protein
MVNEIKNMRGNTRLKNFFHFLKKIKMQYKKKHNLLCVTIVTHICIFISYHIHYIYLLCRSEIIIK